MRGEAGEPRWRPWDRPWDCASESAWAEVTGGRSATLGGRGPGPGSGLCVSCRPEARAEAGTVARRPLSAGPWEGALSARAPHSVAGAHAGRRRTGR